MLPSGYHQTVLEEAQLVNLPPAAGDPPFRGLQYFVSDAELFFGREAPTAKLVEELRRGTNLPVAGASGSGRSSLLRAGLVPALKQSGPLAGGTLRPAGSANWPVRIGLACGLRPLKCPYPARGADPRRHAQNPAAVAVPVRQGPGRRNDAPQVDTRYRQRQQHEDSFAQWDHHLAGKCLPKPHRLIREPNERGQKRKAVGTELSQATMTGLKPVAGLRHWGLQPGARLRKSGLALLP
jgi:hypothetical protein